MTLGKKILIIIGAVFICALVVTYAVSRRIVLGSFARLEKETVATNVMRVRAAITEEVARLNSTGGDWAGRNETCDFVFGKNKAFVEENLTDYVLTNLRLNFMVFVNTSKRVVHAKGVDLNEGVDAPISKNLLDYITEYIALMEYKGPKDSKSGMIVLEEEGPVLISAWPITNSEVAMPINGTLIVGRYLNEQEVKSLAERTRLSISLVRCAACGMPGEYEQARSELSKDKSIVIRRLDKDSIAGYTELADIYGSPGLLLRVDMPRNIYMHGKTTGRYFMWTLLFIGGLVVFVLLVLLHTMVLGPVSELTGHVERIALTGDLTLRLDMQRDDEIGMLAREFDDMVGELYEARKKLMKQSCNSTMAEVAS